MPTLANKQTYLESGQQFETKHFLEFHILTHFSTEKVMALVVALRLNG